MKLSSEVSKIIEFTNVISDSLGHSHIGSEHLLLAIIGKNDIAKKVYTKYPELCDMEYGCIVSEVIRFNESNYSKNKTSKVMSEYKRILSKSYIRAFSKKSKIVDIDDVIETMLSDSECNAVKILRDCKDNILIKETDVHNTRQEMKEKILNMRKETPSLNHFSRDLTLEAVEDRLDPVLERDLEIERVIRILLRKNKCNPCLIGSAGVGKSAIAEGVAEKIIKGAVPDELRYKRIVSLDIALLLAGAKYRGDFEERIKKVFDEVKSSKNVILFIDEIHNIVNAGNGEGTLDAANILKPELARGNICVIGATTSEEYSKTIERDAALERRFQKVKVEEPSVETALKILQGSKKRYESFHKIKIEDEALKKAINLSVKDLPDRFLPDKAFDIIDEAATLMRFEGKEALSSSDVERCFYSIFKNSETISHNKIKAVTDEVQGQSQVVEQVIDAIQNKKHFLDNASPLAFVFAGPTGVGKSMLAKSISKHLLGEHTLLKLDMGEYAEKNTVSKLIGAPPGYVGYDDNGIFFNALLQNPRRVILFDDVEKAHPDVLMLLLNILDDGIIKTVKGKTVSFRDCIIILTTGVGDKNKNYVSGFSTVAKTTDSVEIEKILGEDLTARIDSIFVFNSANKETSRSICSSLINKCREICFAEKISLEVDNNVIDKIIEKTDIDKFGYRGLIKTFAITVEKQLKKAWSQKNKGLTKIRIYVNEQNEISEISYFKQISLENNKLSMYNILNS